MPLSFSLNFSSSSQTDALPVNTGIAHHTFVSETVPTAINLIGGMDQLCSFFRGVGVNCFQLVAKEVYQGMTGPLNLSMHTIGASLYLFPTPFSLAFRNESRILDGELIPVQRTLTVRDERPEAIFPPTVLTSKPVDSSSAALFDIRVLLPLSENSNWNSPYLNGLLSAAGLGDHFNAVLPSATVLSQGRSTYLSLASTISIDAVPKFANSRLPAIEPPAGIPVLDGKFKITRIQIVEPKIREAEKILMLLGGRASVEAVVDSGLFAYARDYFLDPRIFDTEALTRIAERLKTQGRSVELAHTQDGGIGMERGVVRGFPRVRNYRSGIDADFGLLTDLPCGLSLGSDLLSHSRPIWHDGKPIDVVLNSMALDFGASNLLGDLLETFPQNLAESLNVKLTDSTWKKFERWAEEGRGVDKIDTFEVQIGGRLNFTVKCSI